jgi:hypothetical protein
LFAYCCTILWITTNCYQLCLLWIFPESGVPTVADDVTLVSFDSFELQTMLDTQMLHANKLRYIISTQKSCVLQCNSKENHTWNYGSSCYLNSISDYFLCSSFWLIIPLDPKMCCCIGPLQILTINIPSMIFVLVYTVLVVLIQEPRFIW